MTKGADRKETLLGAMAAHVLAEGLGAASLRPLAKAAKTSDRMLLYHFGSKDALMAAVLGRVAADLTAQLEARLPRGETQPFAGFVDAVAEVVADEAVRPYLRLWLGLAATAAHEGPARAALARAIADGFRDWIEAHLRGGEAERRRRAALLFTVIEGAVVLQEVGHGETARLAFEALK